MNPHLQNIMDLIGQDSALSADEKSNIINALKGLENELKQNSKTLEAQGRELEIEVSLEQVRTVAMSMKRREDMLEICRVISQQLTLLNVREIRNVQTAIFYEHKGTYHNYEYYAKHDKSFITEVSYRTHPMHEDFAIQMLKGPNEFFTHGFTGKQVQDWYEHQKTTNVFIDDFLATAGSLTYYWHSLGPVALGITTYCPLNEEEIALFRRFLKVFELSYTRYLDIEQAEAQSREAQIQLSLERVRARTMAMHNSDDVTSATETMFDELKKLGISNLRCGIANIHYNRTFDVFGVTNLAGGNTMSGFGLFGMDEHPVWQHWFESWINKEEVFVAYLAGQEKEEYFDNINNHSNYLPQKIVNIPDNFFQAYFFEQGSVWTYSLLKHSEAEKEIMKRFATSFSLTFRRYQDLLKAEGQAKEAQIENALEKVRSRTMAMQESNELAEVALSLFQQVKELGIEAWATGFNIWQEGNDSYIDWITGPSGEFMEPYTVDLTRHPIFREISDARKKGEDFHVFDLQGKGLAETYELLSSFVTKREFELLVESGFQIPTRQINHYVFGAQVSLMFITYEPCPEAHDIFKRFGKVFEQTYTRFLDLQKAEAQSIEAQIEASLERVRSKTMAMHSSNDVGDTVHTLFNEFVRLGIQTNRCGILIFADEPIAEVWTAKSNPDGRANLIIGKLDLTVHELLHGIYRAWKKKESIYTYTLEDADLRNYYEALNALQYYPAKFDTRALPSKEFHSDYFFPEGSVFAFTAAPIPEGASKVIKRFAALFGQTYRRYLDLQKAEAQTVEAVKRASVDRIRAEIASMRTINDLERITPLIWNELTTLGVLFIRCGVFIMDEEHEIIHTHLATPDGKAISAFHLPYTTPGKIGDIPKYWRQKQIYAGHWSETDFTELADTLVTQGAIATPSQYLDTLPRGGFYLHFLPFLQGMLYVGNSSLLSEDERSLIQSIADAFSTAYARYEDFNKLELAKGQIEKTLVDLKQAQTLLVQSEKMASLGELTAGIAHEIQNPLNFVNNFSDVNTELIEELKTVLKEGNMEEVIAIANDIKANEVKINHHGKRADAIVKGMLQHSRTSGNIKEPADINALADEYFRLAYHGLRAKDKSFNATLKTDYDETIGRINIIPQDIGRVILNIITNAFYTVNEKKKKQVDDYDPTVSLTTKKTGDTLEIKVTDNGNGIPQKVVDKIFQPFFTTKPTGQGTGLGLSLAYDIVKAHGGEITVGSNEGEGSEFVIHLPISN